MATPGSVAGGHYKASDIGIAIANSGAANTAAWNSAIGEIGGPIQIDFIEAATGSNYYSFNGALRWPTSRSITVDGKMGAVLVQFDTTKPVFQFFVPADQYTGWYGKRAVIRNVNLNPRDNMPCIATDNSGSYDPAFDLLIIERVDFVPYPVTQVCYGIDFVTGYSVMPLIQNCRTSFGPLIRWRSGREEPHATSVLRLIHNRTMVQTPRRFGPDIHLAGHRNARIEHNIIEGSYNWADYAGFAAARGASGLYVENPGPHTQIYTQNWYEHSGTPVTGEQEFAIGNEFTTAAGAHQPRSIFLLAEGGRGTLYNASAEDVMTVYIEKSHGCTITRSGSNIDIIERDAHALPLADQQRTIAQSGNVYESPVSPGRREPHAEPIYVYKGGTGNHNKSLTRTANVPAVYPHRHPTYGSALALRLSWPPGPFTIASYFNLEVDADKPRRIFERIWACSPHHTRQCAETDPLWCQFSVMGTPIYRGFPNGFTPERLGISKLLRTTSDSKSNYVFPHGDHRSKQNGGVLTVPANPWILIYAASVAYDDPLPVNLNVNPSESWEWVPGEGPPPGTYGLGDVVYGRDRHVRCTRGGTSRTLSFTATQAANSSTLTNISGLTNLLEGDYIKNSRNETAQIIAINDNNTITLDGPMKANITGASFVNWPPTWKTL